jgi:hypothetical protein
MKLLSKHLEANISGTPPPGAEQTVEQRAEQKSDRHHHTSHNPGDMEGEQCATDHDSKQFNLETDTAQYTKNSPSCDNTKQARCASQDYMPNPHSTTITCPYNGRSTIICKGHTEAQRQAHTPATSSANMQPQHTTRLTNTNSRICLSQSRIISQEALNLLIMMTLSMT